MRIAEVIFRDFPPFADGSMEFPPSASNASGGKVQLLTGQNGTGKTRLLCLLAAACGNRAALDARSSPSDELNIGVIAEDTGLRGVWSRHQSAVFWSDRATPTQMREVVTGGPLFSAKAVSQTFTDRPDAKATAALAFRGIARVSDAKIAALAPVKLAGLAEHLTFEPAKNEDEIIGQSMSNLKMAAAMDQLRRTSESPAIRLMQRLEDAVSRITGREFAFDVTPHPVVRLRVFWGGVTMSLAQTPDGLRSIIGWLVSCVSKLSALFPEHPDPLSVPLILLLDEPEGHLHPAWQRKVLPAAQTLFPQAQIFAATHSPFVISSVNEGWIHVFRADEAGVVTIDKPRACSKGDTYLDVVEDVLGVKEWYDPETEELLAKFRRTRDAVLAGRTEVGELESQATAIADRSRSLRDLMGRELRQIERLMAQTPSRP